MAKDRNILCEYYINSNGCKFGKKCNIYTMQNCIQYKKDDKRKPFRINNKKQKLEKIRLKDK